MDEFLSRPHESPALDGLIKELDNKRHINAAGKEYWNAREIHTLFGYPDFDVFNGVIQRAIVGCRRNNVTVEKHFLANSVMITIGKGGQRKVSDFYLSRLACYLIAMEGNANKIEIAAAKAYFAVQTRRQEEFDAMPDDLKRLTKRKQVATNYTELSKAAVGAGVAQKRIGIFHDKGYLGLYDGRSARSVKQMKGLDADANLMDFIGLEELAAHDFKNTQTTRQLKERGINTEQKANEVHFEVGRRVRKAIAENGNPMPETLPLEEDIKKIERRLTRELKGKKD
jgi:DNA-damage-inducible protein D